MQGSAGSFVSGGRAVAVEWFSAPTPASPGGRAPAVLLLHGADGLALADAYRLGARITAAGGIPVAFVHYLDRTGDNRVFYPALRRNYPLWVETVADALGWLAARPEVDPDRMGIVGVSLGATLAMEVAGRDPRVKVLVDFFGPLPEDFAASRPHLPPTLILHGAADGIVPVTHARALEKLLTRAGTPHEIQIYQGQGHGFVGPAQLDAAMRGSAFLRRHLGMAPSDGGTPNPT